MKKISIFKSQMGFSESHHILTCVSVSRNDAARPALSEELRYLLNNNELRGLRLLFIAQQFHLSTYRFRSNVDSSWKT